MEMILLKVRKLPDPDVFHTNLTIRHNYVDIYNKLIMEISKNPRPSS